MVKVPIRTRLLRACYSFLLPIARFLLRHGISYSEFAEVSRIAFVEVAGQDYGIRGRPTNISRISAMTGIGRKEVRRLRQFTTEYPGNPRVDLSPLSDLLHRWFTDPAYLDADGKPRKLSTRGKTSFAKLVKECAGDLPVGAIKVELLRCGAVTADKHGRLTAKRRDVVPDDMGRKLETGLVFGLRGLASTIAFNTTNTVPELGRIERFVESDPLPEQRIARIRGKLRKRIVAFTESIDSFFSDAELGSQVKGRRIGVGVYYYEDD